MNSILNWLFRIISAMVLLCVTAFCVFGFLASFEPGNGLPWKIGYGALVCGGLVGAVTLLVRTRARTLGALALFAVAMLCVLGFLESYLSLPGQVVYGVLGCGCLAGGVALLGQRGNNKQTACH
jgi:hypothetical protein